MPENEEVTFAKRLLAIDEKNVEVTLRVFIHSGRMNDFASRCGTDICIREDRLEDRGSDVATCLCL